MSQSALTRKYRKALTLSRPGVRIKYEAYDTGNSLPIVEHLRFCILFSISLF